MAEAREPVAAAPLLSLSLPLSHLHGWWKSAWNRRKGGVLEHAQTVLAAQLSLFFLRIGAYVRGSSTQCWSLRPTIHSCNHKHGEALALRGRITLLLFNFPFLLWHGMSWTERCRGSGRVDDPVGMVWWKRGPQQAQRDRGLHRASCLNADNQLEIYMTVLLHCL